MALRASALVAARAWACARLPTAGALGTRRRTDIRTKRATRRAKRRASTAFSSSAPFSGALTLLVAASSSALGRASFLSDHFAVCALLDVDLEHSRVDRSEDLARKRRAALTGLRDRAALAERQGDLEAHRLGAEAAGVERQRALEADQAEAESALRAARKAAEKAQSKLRGLAFGPGTLFAAESAAPGVGLAPPPPAPSTLQIAELEGLPGGDARAAWAHLRARGGDRSVPGLGGFKSAGNTCFANAVLQVLLRLPAVAIWLSEHASGCAAGACLLCELGRARVALGCRPAAAPSLVARVGAFPGLRAFAGGGQHDAAEFCGCLLDALHEGELAAGRRADWLGAPGEATHVDRLFGFVLEKRLRCESCGDFAEQRSVYSTDRVLHLPVPAPERAPVWTATELYFLRCAPSIVDLQCCRCGPGSRFREQERLLTQPNVLLLHPLRRERGSLTAVRHPVQPEKDLSLPGHGRYELSAVVYHQGARAEAGHYYCVAQAHDGKWWRFDDVSARPFRDDVERSQLRSVHLLVYTRPRGQARFAHMGPCSSPAARGGASVGSAWVLRALRAWAPETWRARAQAFVDARKADVGATDVVSVTDGDAEALRDGVLSENRDAVRELLQGWLPACGRRKSEREAWASLGEDFSTHLLCAVQAAGRAGGGLLAGGAPGCTAVRGAPAADAGARPQPPRFDTTSSQGSAGAALLNRRRATPDASRAGLRSVAPRAFRRGTVRKRAVRKMRLPRSALARAAGGPLAWRV